MPLKFQPVYYVYVLVDPRDGEIRYVGATEHLKIRFRSHIIDGSDSRPIGAKQAWLMELLDDSKEPIMEPIASCSSKSGVADLERYWIRMFRSIGCPLTNGMKTARKPVKLVYPTNLKRLHAYV